MELRFIEIEFDSVLTRYFPSLREKIAVKTKLYHPEYFEVHVEKLRFIQLALSDYYSLRVRIFIKFASHNRESCVRNKAGSKSASSENVILATTRLFARCAVKQMSGPRLIEGR